MQFEGRPVYVIHHFDEGHFHTHFLVFYKDPEHPKAPRVPAKTLGDTKGHPSLDRAKRIMPGAGKQRHVGLQRDKEMQENSYNRNGNEQNRSKKYLPKLKKS